jgi:hypothetical protein
LVFLKTRARGSDFVKTVEGKRGLWWWANFVAYAALMMIIVAMSMLVMLSMLRNGNSQNDEVLNFVPVQLLFGIVTVTLALRHQWISSTLISQSGIHVQSGRNITFLPFANIRKVGDVIVRSNIDSWHVMTVLLENNQNEMLHLKQFDNYKILEQSVLAFAVQSNSEVEIDEHWLKVYGRARLTRVYLAPKMKRS